ncbi:MAG: TIGR00269 family protein [Methanothrix sp.]|nr:TIGR00269 family protein [Methanothrix sp.]
MRLICSKCSEGAIVSQHYSGLRLCRGHFIQDFESRATETVHKNNMIKDGERIAVAVSGGKDSTALLFCLCNILAKRDVELVAVTVDEGIAGYRDDTIKAARAIAKQLAVEQHIVSFREEYGYNLDEMVPGKKVAPCTYCGVFRKNALNRAAKHLGADKVATGHNLDDEAQSVMMNYLKGDFERLMRLRPGRAQRGLVPRIKPLREMPEKEIALYCMVNEVFTESRECPYASLSLRADVRDMMNRLESLFPGTKQSTVQGFEKMARKEQGGYAQMELAACRECGEPCVKGLCKACELLGLLRSDSF